MAPLDTQLTPDKLVASSPRLSSLPEIFYMINEVINDPNSSFGDVARVIGYDSSLTARLLHIVNSPFYNFPQKVETITHAISIVGTEQLRDLALATTVLTTFDNLSPDQISMNSFWRHSLATGIAARCIAQQCRQANSERYFLAGILHDIGRLILLENQPEISAKLFDPGPQNNSLLFEQEEKILGFNHGAIGAALCRSWKLPPILEEGVEFHHHPTKARRFPLETAILYLGDLISKAMELGHSGDALVPPLSDSAWERIGLEVGHLEIIWNNIEGQYDETVNIVLSR